MNVFLTENYGEGEHVPHGAQLKVDCEQKHETKSDTKIACDNGTWSVFLSEK